VITNLENIFFTVLVASQIKAYLLSMQTHTQTHNWLFQPGLTVTHPGALGPGAEVQLSLSPSLGKDLHSYPSHPPDEPSPIHTA